MNLPFLQLTLERNAYDARGPLGLILWDGAADGVLGTALRNEDDGDALFAQRAKQAVRGSRDADHAGAFDVHQRNVLDAGDALDRQLGVRLRADERAGLLRRKRVADPDRNIAADGRGHRLRMNDFGAEVGELHRLVVRQRIDDGRFGDAARIRREHPVHVRPDMNLAGFQQRAEDRAGVVAAVAAEGRLHAAPIGSDEPGDDQDTLEIARDEVGEILVGVGPLHAGPEGAPFDDDDPARIQPLGLRARAAPLLQEAVEQLGRPDLAIADDQIAHIARRGAGEFHGLQDARQVVAVAIETGQVQASRFR